MFGCCFFNMDLLSSRNTKIRRRPIDDDTRSDSGVLEDEEELCKSQSYFSERINSQPNERWGMQYLIFVTHGKN